ncbi:DUF55-domain-containing protein [Mollisia scopiformis]|uniref:Thymocyte nuclear protein 1 n=1 Tax=Mollisia scopiformis TaxID=149040 RepID=A0A194X3D8_MOLSC|nr:DUF55-domain-containing protein [Mollisia scopiformis]KUJ14681.1 DUF55-domain-containing protein [Mollisia scopiformis]
MQQERLLVGVTFLFCTTSLVLDVPTSRDSCQIPRKKMPKRKAKDLGDVAEPRRSSRRISTAAKQETVPETTSTKGPSKAKPKKGATATNKKGAVINGNEDGEEEQVPNEPADATKAEEAKPSTKTAPAAATDSTASTGRQYWLMKAEPETRLENGHDVRFSIDDLASKTEPEPWDGIRAYPARNNLRSMKKGDLAFFYHSNCKTPAIVGTMEIVQEHSPDLSAHDLSAPYYDPKSKPSDPKWSVVHVTFKQKLKTPVTLKEMKAWQSTKGHPMENFQMLKLARISVSKVSAGEWEFLCGEMEKNGDVVEQ